MATTNPNDSKVMQARRDGYWCVCKAKITQGKFIRWGSGKCWTCESCDQALAAMGAKARAPASIIRAKTEARPRYSNGAFTIIASILRSIEEGDTVIKVGTSVTLKGENIPGNAEVKVAGRFVANAKGYGMDFEVQTVLEDLVTDEGIQAFLERLPNVGPAIAQAIVAKFGKDVFEVLDKSPQALVAIRGITPERAQEIGEAFQASKALTDAYVFLGRMGVGPAVTGHAIKAWGKDVPEVLTEDPYQLMELPRVGFLTADLAALKMGVSRNDPRRAEAFALHLMDAARQQGHVWVPADILGANLDLDTGDL